MLDSCKGKRLIVGYVISQPKLWSGSLDFQSAGDAIKGLFKVNTHSSIAALVTHSKLT